MNKAKNLLDQLMGTARDVSKSDKAAADWKDRTICKSFLVGFCPYDKEYLGGRRSIDPCGKVHNAAARAAFENSEDGVPGSAFRTKCEDVAFRDFEDAVAAKESYGKKQVEILSTEAKKFCRLPEEVNQKISGMRREGKEMKERATKLDDAETRLKEQLTKDADVLLKDAEDYTKEEERKARALLPEPKACEICGTGYKGDEDYKSHLQYRMHNAYEEIQKKFEELRAGKEERTKKIAEVAADERKKRMAESTPSEDKRKRSGEREGDKKRRQSDDGDLGNGVRKQTQADRDRWDEEGKGKSSSGNQAQRKTHSRSRRRDDRRDDGRDDRRGARQIKKSRSRRRERSRDRRY